MRQKSWNQFKKTMAASTLAGAITFTGCAVMPSVTAFADTTEQTGQVSYDNEVMPIHTDVQTEAKPLMKGTSCTVSDGKNLYYAFEMMGVRMGIMKYNTKTGKKSEVYSYKIGKNTYTLSEQLRDILQVEVQNVSVNGLNGKAVLDTGLGVGSKNFTFKYYPKNVNRQRL